MGTNANISDSSKSRYSIWLMPAEENVFGELQNTINSISNRYSTPSFEPHVTLMAGISGIEDNVIDSTHYLASRIDRCMVELGSIGRSREYFRSLFVRVQKNKEIESAADLAKEVFERYYTREYTPHLSFVYADIPDSQKDRIIEEYGLVQLVRKISAFTIGKLSLYYTYGRVDEWQKIREFELMNPVKEARSIL
jgi:hypothetical protein